MKIKKILCVLTILIGMFACVYAATYEAQSHYSYIHYWDSSSGSYRVANSYSNRYPHTTYANRFAACAGPKGSEYTCDRFRDTETEVAVKILPAYFSGHYHAIAHDNGNMTDIIH